MLRFFFVRNSTKVLYTQLHKKMNKNKKQTQSTWNEETIASHEFAFVASHMSEERICVVVGLVDVDHLRLVALHVHVVDVTGRKEHDSLAACHLDQHVVHYLIFF